jgi:drug/metabolite transporter (DMT)-like permease
MDYRELEPRTGIHPALRFVVGIIGAATLIGAGGLLLALIADEGDRDWSLLAGVAACAAIAWGCWLIAFRKLDETEVGPLKARSPRVRLLVMVACVFAIAQTAFDVYRSGFTVGRTVWAVLLALLLVSVIVDNWKSRAIPGK